MKRAILRLLGFWCWTCPRKGCAYRKWLADCDRWEDEPKRRLPCRA